MGICILGMGDCNSTSKTDISDITNNDTDINNSITTNINQDCNQLMSQSNVINIIGSTVKKLSAQQKNSLQSVCIMQSILKSQTSAEVINKLLDQVKTNIETKGALLGSPASNETISQKLTTNKTKINNAKFNDISKKCIQDIKQSNLLNIIGSNVEDTTTDQANEAFLKCLSAHSDDTVITASDLSDTKIDSDITTKTQGGDVLKSAGEAAKDLGQGVGAAAKGVGEGAGAWISSFIVPFIIALVCIVCASIISSLVLTMNPGSSSAAQDFARTAAEIYKNR